MILRKFLFLKDFEPHDSYKKNSYKKNGVCEVSILSQDLIIWSFLKPGTYIIDAGYYNLITVEEANLLCNKNGLIYRSTPQQKFKVGTFSSKNVLFL